MRGKRNTIEDYYLVFHQENKDNNGMIKDNLISFFYQTINVLTLKSGLMLFKRV